MGSNEDVAIEYPSLKNLDSEKNSFGGVWPEKKFRTKDFVIESSLCASRVVSIRVYFL